MNVQAAILTKRVQFEAAHDLPGHCGKCAQLHGHSYVLEVSIRGLIKQAPGESDHGMVMDFADLSEIIHRAVLIRLDHRYINEILVERTTAENLAHWIWEALIQEGLCEYLLYRVRLWETPTGSVEITREERAHTHESARSLATDLECTDRLWNEEKNESYAMYANGSPLPRDF